MHTCLYYYLDKCPSWHWYFKHRNAPSVKDLYKYIKKIEIIKDNHFNIDTPFKPFENLMMVLPIESLNLLPNFSDNFFELLAHMPDLRRNQHSTLPKA